MEKEFHIYLGKFRNEENEFPLILYILAEKGSDYDDWVDNAVRILANRIGVRQSAILVSTEGAWK